MFLLSVNDLPFGRLNVKPDYLLMTALFIYPLPRSAADMDKLRAETRTKAEHLADGIQPREMFHYVYIKTEESAF